MAFRRCGRDFMLVSGDVFLLLYLMLGRLLLRIIPELFGRERVLRV